eukprot:scaffold2850_cov235-Pinguiococcus_pyrenoidosus.AAC.16
MDVGGCVCASKRFSRAQDELIVGGEVRDGLQGSAAGESGMPHEHATGGTDTSLPKVKAPGRSFGLAHFSRLWWICPCCTPQKQHICQKHYLAYKQCRKEWNNRRLEENRRRRLGQRA